MPTAKQIIQSAYRRAGILATGVNMNAPMAEVGLELLRGLYQNLIVGGMFGRTRDVIYDSVSDTVAEEGTRVYNKQSATITLPVLVDDRCHGGKRQPRDGAFITLVDPVDERTEQWIYDRSLGRWTEINSLALDTEAPLGGRFEDHIKSLLAVRLLGDIGQPTPPELTRQEGRARLALASQYDGERQPGRSDYA